MRVRPSFSKEQREQIVAEAIERKAKGETAKAIASDHGLAATTLDTWIWKSRAGRLPKGNQTPRKSPTPKLVEIPISEPAPSSEPMKVLIVPAGEVENVLRVLLGR